MKQRSTTSTSTKDTKNDSPRYPVNLHVERGQAVAKKKNAPKQAVPLQTGKPHLDPTVMKDWQIAEAAEDFMKPVELLAQELGLKPSELIHMGRQLAKVDYLHAMQRLSEQTVAKYIDVTAITPTPLGEGKTTTSIGLVEGLGRLGKRVTGAIRQPSGGPTFNIKGSAAARK